MRFFLTFSVFFLLVACPDPTSVPGTVAVDGVESAKGPGAGGAGKPPTGPADGGPGATGFKVAAGQGVIVSGTFSYTGKKTGALRLDFLEEAEGAGGRKLAHVATIDAFGEWKVEAPKNFGTVRLMAFIDENGDGPSESDPVMAWPDPVEIGEADIGGLDFKLTDEPQLHDLAPGANAGDPPGPPPPDGSDQPTGVGPDVDKVDADAAEAAGEAAGTGSDAAAEAPSDAPE